MDPEQILQFITDQGNELENGILLLSLIIMLLLVASAGLLYRKLHRLERMIKK